MAAHRPSPVPSFADAIAAVAGLGFRADLVVHDIPAPSGLAPEAYALAADVRPDDDDGVSAYGTGRLVLLHDADEPEAWDGAWRIVCFAQAPLEPEIGIDPLVAEVAWSWLVDALSSRGAAFHAMSGTATKTLSQGFGGLAAEGTGAQIELRASWSPTGDIVPHVEAWAELVCMLAGLPPGSENAPLLRAQSRTT
ncbi:DUF3000 domain-containing protein [Microbacterium sp. SORGH_AS_0888]|uniref:DUF3000 domain-containing protein n=1 Tax=Microbacterium sp. SORGH_AS_0888 TaxID=3041791 RepID=UPI00278B56DA|nr:DUF3000 domain-containing protein [Microbacterium sp. SORGH_AS_0888]MDQ1128567.1 hypothetical protein [Microbacterium sp. SORGH_AS_0888]